MSLNFGFSLPAYMGYAASFGIGSSLALDFTSGNKTLDPRITFSRTTNATVTGSNGLIQYAPHNLLTYSEQFDNAAWTKSNSTITANSVVAPDGTTTADKLVEDTATSTHRVLNTSAVVISTTIATTYTIYAKAAERTDVRLTDNDLLGADFDLLTGGVSNISASVTATTANIGNGWWRLSISRISSTANGRIVLNLMNSGTTSYTGNGTSGVYIWGAQLEIGSTATTYNPTTVKNLLGYTQEFDNAAWTKSNATVTANATTAPDGSLSADKLVENTATSGHYVLGATVSLIPNTPYAGFVYAKAAERTQVAVTLSNAFTSLTRSIFDLSSGTVVSSTASVTSATITPVGNGWYLCGISSVCAGVAAGQLIVQPALSGNASYTGDGTSGIYIWGAQLSDSASVDPYVYNPVAAPSAAAYYGPRFDYDPITLAPKGLLIEEQRTNLLTYSDQFDNAAWVKTNTSATANSVVAPDGTSNADTLTDDTTNSFHMVGSVGVTFTASTAYAFTTYAKAGTASIFQLSMDATPFSAAAYANFNLSTGAVGAAGAGVTSSMTPMGNGWYRCSMVVTSGAGGGLYRAYIGLINNQNTASMRPTYVGSGQSVYLWGAQLEAGAFATSYIPTVASQVTRSADIAQMLGANFSNWYNQSAGTLYVETAVEGWNSGNNNTAVAISAGSSGSSVITTLQSYNGTGRPRSLAYNASAVLEADMYPASTVAPNVVCKQALAIALNDYALSKDGAAVIADTSATVPTVDRLVIGAGGAAGGSSTGFMNGWVKRIAYYNRRLANSELQGITA